MAIADKPLALNPWQPMTDPLDIKHLGKLGEEANELGSAACRCMIQGIDEREPVTGKLNREWLEDEMADVLANIDLNITHFDLNVERIMVRKHRKMAHLKAWHALPAPPTQISEEERQRFCYCPEGDAA